ncbi:Hypothetical predicted protein [Xyrichtys novacula]|uniref:Uncharacterized protein n=1 Tax=Xyrichtys novacula TaxID=13765 RepID=A0AAV1F8D8_XYRNO|nr:Hypothetical predicted protein [Xyrichtys novacula]
MDTIVEKLPPGIMKIYTGEWDQAAESEGKETNTPALTLASTDSPQRQGHTGAAVQGFVSPQRSFRDIVGLLKEIKMEIESNQRVGRKQANKRQQSRITETKLRPEPQTDFLSLSPSSLR